MNNPMPLSRQIAVFASCLASLALLGWVDYATGYEFGFFVFYSGPVGFAAWHLGRRTGILVSFAATITWGLADALNGQHYSSVFYLYWNNLIHFTCFLINAVALAKIKRDLDKIHRLSAELETARHALRALAARLPTCPVCGKSHPFNSTGPTDTLPAETQAHPDMAPALCEACRTLQPEKPSSGGT